MGSLVAKDALLGAEAEPVGVAVERLDPVGDHRDRFAQGGFGQEPEQHLGADHPAELAKGPVEAVLRESCRSRRSRVTEEIRPSRTEMAARTYHRQAPPVPP